MKFGKKKTKKKKQLKKKKKKRLLEEYQPALIYTMHSFSMFLYIHSYWLKKKKAPQWHL